MSDKIKEEVMIVAKEYFRTRGLKETYPRPDSQDEAKLLDSTSANICSLMSKCSPFPITLSTTTIEYGQMEQQYVKLRMWMSEASEPCKGELAQILFPVFIHFYIDIFIGLGKQSAKVFYQRHFQIFKPRKDYENLIRAVCCPPADNVNDIPAIQNLRAGKFQIRLSEMTVNYLLQYLNTSDSPSVLQVFNDFIDIESSDASDQQFPGLRNKTHLYTDSMDTTTEDLSKLDSIIQAASRVKPSMPSICTYTVYNAFNGLTCAKVDENATLIGCGFEDSVVKIWKLRGRCPSLQTSNVQQNVLGSNPVLSLNETDVKDESKSSRVISGGEIFNLRGHSSSVYDVAFSSNYMFSVSEDTTMRLWNLETGQSVCIYQGHQYPIFCVEVSPGMVYAATGSYDQSVRLWSSEMKHPVRTFAGHSGSVNCISFHPNCSYVASGSFDKSVRMWQINDGSAARVFLQHSHPVSSLCFSPDGKYLASGSSNGEVYIWDLASAKVLWRCPQVETSPLVSLCWTRASNQLISAFSNGSISSHYINANSGDNLDQLGLVNCSNSSNTLVNNALTSQNFLVSVLVSHDER